jgi:large subunit ribosomal protein L9
MGVIAERLQGLIVTFPARASETGKLYGSITTQQISDAITKKTGVEVHRRQIDVQPLRSLGEHEVRVRLTVDLIPHVTVIVHREGEAVSLPGAEPAAPAAPAAPAPEAQAEPETVLEAGGEEIEA